MRQSHEFPEIGSWYWDYERRERFEVVALDNETKSIEIQYFTGNIEEVDEDTWFSMKLISIAPPKDWSGPFELDKDQFSELGDDIIHPNNWSDPLQPFEDAK